MLIVILNLFFLSFQMHVSLQQMQENLERKTRKPGKIFHSEIENLYIYSLF